MNEYNEFISQQTAPPYGGQSTSEWSADERPADLEPPQDTAPAPEVPAADAEASLEESEPVAEEAQTAQDAESQDVQEAAPEAEAQTAQETERDAEPRAAEEAETGTEPPAAEDTGSNARADLTAEHLIDSGDAERFHSGWREVKAAFVDDPADAVRQASALVGEAVDEVTTALTRLRQNLDEQSQDTDPADTERLRQVMRGYGSLLTDILTR